MTGTNVMLSTPRQGGEPIWLSPEWKDTNKPLSNMNLKSVTVDQTNLELNPPSDRFNVVLLIFALHGIGALIPWNMFITTKSYFVDYKLSTNYTGVESHYSDNFLSAVGLCAQIPNFSFNWLNIFFHFEGDLTRRIVWVILIQVFVLVSTVILAMIDTSSWPGTFFWITMISIVILNIANGVYQNSVFGMAAKFSGKYTAVMVLGSNISGTITSIVSLISLYFAPSLRTSAIYCFITTIIILLACFDTYLALPINRFYRYYEHLYQKEAKKKEAEFSSNRPLLWKVFKQCKLHCFNIWFVYFVTLSMFPTVLSDVKMSDPNFIIPEKYYSTLMCFMTFNVSCMSGSYIASFFQWPSKKYVILPILIRVLYIPLLLVCNYLPIGVMMNDRQNILITNDWIFFAIVMSMGFTSGYFATIATVYCSGCVEPQYSSIAGMFGAAFIVTGIFTGIIFSWAMPVIIGTFG